ncbi:hypothetical protein [Pelotalea chapellei]|uniref:Histidine kinase n=1 Tax=Pelotalea chapellei TaxID=44671 RepID=A0ABS5U8Y4_9BACT|nr:hypothetical protein [Pelotalea chapellei]MBT1072132.1 hypothetical protein [Pelotalea chapellei]
MKLKKAATIAAAAGALAAISVPAMAFENEFHGMYKLKYFVSDYENGGSGYITPSTTVEKNKANNYFEQRARIFYTAKANDDLKLVTAFEIDSVFGDRAQGGIISSTNSTTAGPTAGTAFRNSGGALESDAVNLETKHVYLDFKIPSTPVRVTAGIQPIKDAFKGVFFDADIAGVNSVSKFGPATVGLGYFRAYDQSYFTVGNTRQRGLDDLHLVALSSDFAINKDLKVGAAYYLYADDRNSSPTTLHVLGANFDAKLGALGLSGFAAAQQGVQKFADPAATRKRATYNGYAFNAAAKLPLGPGNLRTAALFTTGERNANDGVNSAWQAVNTSNGAATNGFVSTSGTGCNSYNDSNMMILNRATNMQGTSTDQSLIYSTNNKNQGVILATLGYDATITPKMYANANAGFAWAAKKNGNRPVNVTKGNVNGSNFQGAEINLETGYKMYDNLTASVQGAYVILGGYYTDTVTGGKEPENPYTARVVLSYAF